MVVLGGGYGDAGGGKADDAGGECDMAESFAGICCIGLGGESCDGECDNVSDLVAELNHA